MIQLIKQMKQKNSKGQRKKTKQEIIDFYEDELENARETRDFHRMSMEWFRKKERVIHKKLTIKNTPFHGVGVRGRNSDNKLIKEKLGWEPNYPLIKGVQITYDWIKNQVK